MKDARQVVIPTPDVVPDSAVRAKLVREMFEEVAPRYDLANRVLSASIDRVWRKRVARALEKTITKPDALALDIACGTADLSLELARHCRTIGCDFCHPMLVIGRNKARRRRAPVFVAEADALQLPFASDRFEAVTIAFGLRNLADIPAGLKEIARVLKPGGSAAILEFSSPDAPLLGPLFLLYFRYVLPLLGKLISGSSFAYQYLPDSVAQFPSRQSLAEMLRAAGLEKVSYRKLSGGIAALHLGVKPYTGKRAGCDELFT